MGKLCSSGRDICRLDPKIKRDYRFKKNISFSVLEIVIDIIDLNHLYGAYRVCRLIPVYGEKDSSKERVPHESETPAPRLANRK